MSKIMIEKTWTVDNAHCNDPLIITKSYLISELTGKKIPNSTVYSVDEFEGDNLNCFKTLKEARAYAKSY